VSCYFKVGVQKWHVRVWREGHNYHIGHYDDENVARDMEKKMKLLSTAELKANVVKYRVDNPTSKFASSKPRWNASDVEHPLSWFQAESKRQLQHFSTAYK